MRLFLRGLLSDLKLLYRKMNFDIRSRVHWR